MLFATQAMLLPHVFCYSFATHRMGRWEHDMARQISMATRQELIADFHEAKRCNIAG
jgi:hypothetical protein